MTVLRAYTPTSTLIRVWAYPRPGVNSDPNLRLSCCQRRFAPAGADGEHGALVQDEADALLHKHTRTVQDGLKALDAKRRLVCGVVTTCAVVTPWLRATLASA